MIIANPIYDSVFKYLMADNKIARLMISKIIGEEIVSLDVHSQEPFTDLDKAGNNLKGIESEGRKAESGDIENKEPKSDIRFTIYRVDFAARVKLADGSCKKVLIEVQKAKLPTDIMRFRKYLGQQYYSNDNAITENAKTTAFPIVSIYFLGYSLDYEKAPVIKVNRTYIDMATGEQLTNKEEFIESLTHDSYIIQIGSLAGKRRTELERILSIFDQSQRKEDYHILNINENDFPEEYRYIIQKLQKAILDPKVVDMMKIEDEILSVIQDKERKILELTEVDKKKDQTISEQSKTISEQSKALSEKDKALSEKDKLIEELMKQLGKK
jgi:hypothetical protein